MFFFNQVVKCFESLKAFYKFPYSYSYYPVSWISQAVWHQADKQMDIGSILFCLSPYSLEVVVYRHCLTSLCSFKMNKTFKWLTPLPILTQKSFQSDNVVLSTVFPSSTSWDLNLWRQLSYQSIKRMNEQCYRSVKRMNTVTDQTKE